MAMESALKQIEGLCKTLFEAPNEAERQSAQQALVALTSTPEAIPQCQYLLDQSSDPYALYVAASSLTKLITTHWNSFTVPQRVDIRNYVLNYLAQKGPGLEDFVVVALVQLVCRITKLGWFDDPAHREIADEVVKFLSASIDHCIIGLKIFEQLVEAINIQSTERTLTQHRKTAISFRDSSLFRIFRTAMTTLRQLQNGAMVGATREQEMRIGKSLLNLIAKCLNFDFIGTNPDESTEDLGTIQVPTSWRAVIQDGQTLQLLFDYYKNTTPPNSALAIEAIILMSSVRRSIFPGEKARSAFLALLISNARDILANQIGLQHQQNYHHFCRLLGRVKCNFQLAELIKSDGYVEWLDLCSDFTIKSFQNWHWSTISLHYLLALWARMVAAVPYVRNDQGAQNHKQRLEQCICNVVQAYVSSMIESPRQTLAPNTTLDDPLEDAVLIREQMERLPVLVRFQYGNLGAFLLNTFEPIFNSYRSGVDALDAAQKDGAVTEQMTDEITLLEHQLTWLVHIYAAVVGAFQWSEASRDGEETMDARLNRQVLQLAAGIDFRVVNTNGAGKADPKLELALIGFLENFRRVYIWENHTLYALGSLQGESRVAHKMVEPTQKQQIFRSVFEAMQMGSHAEVVELLVRKLAGNLKYWGGESDIIHRSLSLLSDMASGFSSSKLLINLEVVKYMIANHGGEAFPFLLHPNHTRDRTVFHLALARLFLGTLEDPRPTFEAFMEPLLNLLAQLNGTADLRTEDARMAIIGVCRDLRGVAAATHNKKTYHLLFEALYPIHFPIFRRAVETWHDDPSVITSVLKFLCEFVQNKGQRLMFDNTSADGILLFRETSSILCAYANAAEDAGNSLVSGASGETTSYGQDLYREKYKPISIILSVLTNALGGNYVNFGVFALYHDKALENAMEMALTLTLSLPLDEVFAYPKLCRAFFQFFEIVFRNHLAILMALDHPSFTKVFEALNEGLQSNVTQISSQAAAAIDHLATFYFEERGRDKPQVRAFMAHMQASPNILSELMSTLFNQVLFGAPANHWSITRPILSLLLAVPETFENFKTHLVSTQASQETRTHLLEALTKLTANVQDNLTGANRDRFTQSLAVFRVDVRGFIAL
uniref:Importin N-terminal domain-containing protein n=1 Tax=Pinguiococcus pyrenoidosus TaxID=172671 RepID=A0A7R9U4R6_9STRA|mmetsp:Transcript_13552/g.50439  ORF Transcript_13552/g.50439 Transcript_13552/m.50439 type:complete len:1114 (+) Transcript_13552:225-3566(+)